VYQAVQHLGVAVQNLLFLRALLGPSWRSTSSSPLLLLVVVVIIFLVFVLVVVIQNNVECSRISWYSSCKAIKVELVCDEIFIYLTEQFVSS